MTGEAVDLEGLLDEIDDEVRRRRADGELDPEFERALDALFAPGGSAGDADYVRLLDEAERATRIDATPPSESQLAGGQAVKRALGRAMSWYVGNIARQVTTLGSDLVGVTRLLGARVARLEAAAELHPRTPRASLAEPHLDPTPLAPVVVAACRSVTGRVLHGDGGTGTLVQALLDADVDAYGTEPRVALAERAVLHDVDMREESVADHLAGLPPDSLGGVVLSGCIDTSSTGDRERVVRAARLALVPSGVLVILGTDPARWGSGATAVVADLAPGRPWRAETWAHVLADHGFDVRPAPGGVPEDVILTVAVRHPA